MNEPRYPFLLVDVDPADSEITSALLFELGADGVEERDESTLVKARGPNRITLVASFSTHEAATEACGALDEEFQPRIEEIVGDGWRDEWKKHFRPFEIAPGIIVRPPWEPFVATNGERVLELEPGRAFGTGLHETTQLVARALHENRARLPGARVLDVGTGSGILGLVALALGATSVTAIDIDEDALSVARENAERNGSSARFAISTASLDEIAETFSIVVANIEARVLVPMAQGLIARLAPGALLFLSGILVGQEDEVRAAYSSLNQREVVTMGEWVLVPFEGR